MKEFFLKNKYCVIKNSLNKDLSNFLFKYLFLKRKVTKYLYENNIIPNSLLLGRFGDDQVDKAFASYSDIAMETLLDDYTGILKEKLDLSLIPTYSYTRMYEKGSILQKHFDRESCELSCTLNLGGDLIWPIFIEDVNKNQIQINLDIGDLLVYEGCHLQHWRNIFQGNFCGQVFLHYNYKKENGSDDNIYDKRAFLGLPRF